MNQDLFKKHILQINKQKDTKIEIIKYVQEITGIILEENSFIVTNKKIIFTVSSVVKTKLHQKKVIEFLTKKGFVIMF